jgi:UDP-galactopyranose mutase
MALYQKYAELASMQKKVVFGGRLGMYRYFDMDDTVNAALNLVNRIL